ncbi:hypothetical protein QR680_012312 [Steinernema hermaphroditum]|uniref:Peptidase M16 N-terminal domain-containing protein n=1 Tax=Steinernema hermaphroditum TaxID=289476 RepID=A0AA39I1M6_9BILA|nr:hypothetical protein QR680_012312 [Steinernema hermaphroditum]
MCDYRTSRKKGCVKRKPINRASTDAFGATAQSSEVTKTVMCAYHRKGKGQGARQRKASHDKSSRSCKGEVQTTVVEKRFVDIKKNSKDPCEYRGLELRNGLRVLLVTNPSSTGCAASMDVHVGNCADPEEIAGMAHLCEHVLLRGSRKYPTKNEIYNFGVYRNGSTNYEWTNYRLGASPACFKASLDRFAHMFISPLFDGDSIEHEVEAVDSEFRNYQKKDSRRMKRLYRTLSRPGHDLRKFSTGNRETLMDIPKSKGLNIRDEMVKFFENHYSSNVMVLCIMGPQSVGELERLVLSLPLHEIPNRNLTPKVYEEHYYGPEETACRVDVIPVKNESFLEVNFATQDCPSHLYSCPYRHIRRYLEYEGKGSLAHELKQRGEGMPRLLESNDFKRIWYLESKRADQTFHALLDLPEVAVDPQNQVMLQLFTKCFEHQTREDFCDAKGARLEKSVTPRCRGLKLSFSVRVRNMCHVFVDYMRRLLAFEPERRVFDIQLDALRRKMDNFNAEQPYEQGERLLEYVLTEGGWSHRQLLEASGSVTFERLVEFIPTMWSALHLELFMYGSLAENEVMQLCSEILPANNSGARPLSSDELKPPREVQIPAGSYFYEHKQSVHSNSCIVFFLQVGGDIHSVTLLYPLALMMRVPASDTLRAKEQLGYRVVAEARTFECTNVHGLCLTVQGPYDPEFVEERIEAFLENFKNTLMGMSEATFRKYNCLEREEYEQYWKEIETKRYLFDVYKLHRSACRRLKKKDLINFYEGKIVAHSDNRQKVSIRVCSTTSHKELRSVQKNGIDEIRNLEHFKCISTPESVDSMSEDALRRQPERCSEGTELPVEGVELSVATFHGTSSKARLHLISYSWPRVRDALRSVTYHMTSVDVPVAEGARERVKIWGSSARA